MNQSTPPQQKNSGIVENLVTQFSSSLDCLRELVQNSIDAGSPQIEVWMEFERGEGHQGVISIHVDDFGEGMDEAIIDEQLTTLFASNKEDDLTKIGKFGIGFVSVFALKPKGVLVHTGRGGEYWEVFFHEDRSFSKTQLELPLEGTQITIFLEGDYHRYRELVKGVRETLVHWCSHSETEVSFEDRSPIDEGWTEPEVINESFEVSGECLTRVTHQGTEIVLAYHNAPEYGFYNRGLTLAYTREGEDVLFERQRRYRHIAFKIKSRYLEHTLSRETVMRDDNYEKAMVLLDEAAAEPLLARLVERIEALVDSEHWGHTELNEYVRLMGFLAREPHTSLMRVQRRPIFRLVQGTPTHLERMKELWERDGRLLFDEVRSEWTDMLSKEGVPVIYGDVHAEGRLSVVAEIFVRWAAASMGRSIKGRAMDVLRSIGIPLQAHDVRLRRSMARPTDVYLPVEVDDEPPAQSAALVARAAELLEGADTGYKRITTCRLVEPTPDAPLFVVAPTLSTLMARPPEQMRHKGRVQVAVNRDHPQFKMLQRQFGQRPQMAAYCLAKDLLLDQDRLLERDVRLMELARAM